MRHLLWGVCRPRWRLEVLMRAHCGRHLSQVRELRLLWMRMHHVAALPELLQVFLQSKLRVGHVLLLLLRGWWLGMIDV